ncbi:hypothetical protein Salat_2698100 [Sesamum alatum]|uniref:Uncharacterized protein n=1 Tax=Sesamum alatum TaxID=300844 RepID=A0AAE2CBD9_9LAMI|nr:hypothetical protein Salat_2698100 [Sesamum alatum]
MGSNEPEIVRICKCGQDLVVRTSWTNSNHGCRSEVVRGMWYVVVENYCGVFEWIDPPMCRRSKDVIPGLLKRLNNQEKQVKEYGQKLRVLEAREDDIVLYRLCGIVACVIILVLLILYSRAMIVCV